MTRLVALSDLHAHPWAAFAAGDGANNSRLRRSLGVLDASLQLATEQQMPWVFAGDLVHTAGYSLNVVLAALLDVFSRYPNVPKLAVWGNHDSRSQGGRITLDQTVWAALVRAVPGLIILEHGEYGLVQIGDLRFSGCGAQPEGYFEYAEPSDVGVYHGIVRGSVGPNGYIFPEGLDPDELRRRHRLSVVGDLHHPQWMGERILIPGSPEHHNFGDAGQHGWWVVDLEHEQDKFYPSGSPEFRTVDVPEQVQNDGHFYRVRHASGAELPAGAIAVAPGQTTVAPRRDIVGRADQAEAVLQAWLQAVPPTEPAAAVLSVGRRLLAATPARHLAPARLTLLRLENFCCYEDATLRVQPGVWLVTGQGRDYPSNGAGKTTLFEALYWLLFGRTTKGLSGDEVIRRGAEVAMVTASFDGGRLVVIRGRGRGVPVLTVTEEDGTMWEAPSVAVMTDKLLERLGLTPELFQALGYFSQERLLLFASATDGERKTMLADLVGLAAYQSASTAASLEATAAVQVRHGIEGQIVALAAAIEHEARQLEAVEREARAWDAGRAERLAVALDALNTGRAREPLRRLELQRAHEATARGELDRRIHACVEQRRTLEAAVAALGDPPTVGMATERVQTAQNTVRAHEAELAATTQAVTMWRSARDRAKARWQHQKTTLDGGTCPTCGRALAGGDLDRCLADAVEELRTAEQALAAATEQAEAVRARVNVAKAVLDEAATALAVARMAEETRSKLAQVEILHQGLERELAAVVQHAEALAATETATETAKLVVAAAAIEVEVNPNTRAVEAMRQQLLEAERTVAAARLRLDEVRHEEAIYAYWQHGFSKQGIQSLLMDEIAARFNALRGEIFPILTQGVYDVQFSTVSRTKAGEAREKTEFLVTERGLPIAYEALSGGQRRRVDVGVMLTLVLAAAAWLRVPGVLGLLVLDEVFGFLDAAGAEGLAEVLVTLGETIPTIYVVSHDVQLQALFPQTICVVQDGAGVSVIEGEHGQSA